MYILKYILQLIHIWTQLTYSYMHTHLYFDFKKYIKNHISHWYRQFQSNNMGFILSTFFSISEEPDSHEPQYIHYFLSPILCNQSSPQA